MSTHCHTPMGDDQLSFAFLIPHPKSLPSSSLIPSQIHCFWPSAPRGTNPYVLTTCAICSAHSAGERKARTIYTGKWLGVAMDSLTLHPGPSFPTLLRTAAWPPLKRNYGRFRAGGLQPSSTRHDMTFIDVTARHNARMKVSENIDRATLCL
jgi:hypothetical protein